MKVPNQPTNQSSGPRSPIYQVSDYGTNLGFAPVNPRGAGYAPAQLQQPRHKMMPMMRQAFNMSGVQTPWQFQQQQKAAEAARLATNPFMRWYYGINEETTPEQLREIFQNAPFTNLGNLGFPSA